MRPIIGITADYQRKTNKIKQDYINALLYSGGLPVIISPFDQKSINRGIDKDTYISEIAERIDGLLLSGGDDISPHYYGERISVSKNQIKVIPKIRTNFELSLLKEIMDRQKPVLGICMGMQLLNVAFGGTLYQDLKSQVNDVLEHNDTEHYINLLEIPELDIDHSRNLVNSTHHQAVKVLGEGLTVFASSDDNIIEGFYKRDYPYLIGVQWHPERMIDKKLSLKIFESFVKNSQKGRKKGLAN